MAYVYTLLALSALVALHELGHFALARAFRMRVDRYSIGFGPVLLSFKRGDTEYALSMLPFGGYVKIAGMAPQDGTEADDPASYANKPAWQRFLTIAAGPVMNYLIAFVLLATLNGLGRPQPVAQPYLGDITPNSPAALGGLKPDDLVVSVDGKPVDSFNQLVDFIRGSNGQPLALTVRRGASELPLSVTPHLDQGFYRIGATPKTELKKLAWGAAIVDAAEETALANVKILTMLGDKLTGHGHLELGGTVEVVAQTSEAARAGAAMFFMVLVQISIFLALFNLLPLPALDGGRLFFLLIEMVARRPVNQRLETTVHAMGFLMLLTFMAYLTVGDVRKRLAPSAEPIPVPSAATDAGP
jgi:regulator of sigma E protease